MKDSFLPSGSTVKQQWYVIDATDRYLGRLSTEISTLLQGKQKAFFVQNKNIGDYVIVINASKIKISGKKAIQKQYFRHSGRPGGKTLENFQDLYLRLPERILEKSVKGMLPKTRLGRRLFSKLKVYKGSNHPHFCQNPHYLV